MLATASNRATAGSRVSGGLDSGSLALQPKIGNWLRVSRCAVGPEVAVFESVAVAVECDDFGVADEIVASATVSLPNVSLPDPNASLLVTMTEARS
jgi:hypothetical protein